MKCEFCQTKFSSTGMLKIHNSIFHGNIKKLKILKNNIHKDCFVKIKRLEVKKENVSIIQADIPQNLLKSSYYDLLDVQGPISDNLCSERNENPISIKVEENLNKNDEEEPLKIKINQLSGKIRVKNLEQFLKFRKCKFCNKSFINPGKLREHIQSTHKDFEKVINLKKCSVKLCKLREHKNTGEEYVKNSDFKRAHEELKCHKCDICSKEFNYEADKNRCPFP